jgi:CRISPR-associated endonuclease/helicase Cas3
VRRPALLAHSAPSDGTEPQAYEEHVANVRRGALARAEAMLRFATPEPEGLLDAIHTAASFHDLGKLDIDNQVVLARGRGARLPWDHIDAGVAYLSSVKSSMAAWLVRAHHAPGLPSRPGHFDRDGLGRKLRGLRWDERSADEHERQIVRTDAKLSTYVALHTEALGAIAVRPVKAIGGLTMRLALSCLVDADHADTVRFDTGFELPDAPEPRWEERLRRLEEYVGGLSSSRSTSRDRHRQEFYRACREADIADPMAACDGPVGIGKTTAIAAYLIHRAQKDGLRRLIVVAPYTNILVQTAQCLREALVLPGEAANEVVVEHHHRADFETPEARDLAVLWRAPVVVTTAVQFFETLAANHPGDLRKLHALPGSAIFIDEAHATLPAHLWPQNWRWVCELGEHWSCRFVFASGSLARFWENSDVVGEPVHLPELLPPELKKDLLTAESRRIRYEKAGLFENVQSLIERVCNTPGPRLVILNTVQSAAVVARALRGARHDTVHLSTALAPKDRAPILKRVYERLSRGDKLKSDAADWTMVATSCVEAGVDLSFRTAFRERFSTASLIQVGGRVNRHGEKGDGIVFDFVVDEGDGITRHPSARFSAAVLKRQLEAGLLSAENDPAALITRAMAEEISDRGGLGHDSFAEAERHRNYPCVAEAGRVIDADTRLVIVDPMLIEQLITRERIGFRRLLAGSVQLWSTKINALRLECVPSRPELYRWPYEYDAEFLGYMAGFLKQVDLLRTGIVIV